MRPEKPDQDGDVRLYKPKYRDRTTGEVKTSPKWSVDYSVNGVRRSKSTGVTDKRSAEEIARNIVRSAERRAAGLETFDPVEVANIPKLVDEYLAEMRRRGRTEQHVRNVDHHVRTLLRNISRLQDATAERIRGALVRVAETPFKRPNEKGPGRLPCGRTVNYYRVSLNGFFVWLVREGRWEKNPVAAVQRARELDPENPRRALTDAELDDLLAATLLGRRGRERRVVYLVASTTGLRRSELRALRWADVDLENATVTIRARSAKNRRSDVLPLSPATVAALLPLKGASDGKVFRLVPRVETLRRDLKRAGIDAVTPTDKIDFHALRVTFGTSLARADVSLTLAQRLMRHSTPVLTANVYTKFQLHDARAAVERLDRKGPRTMGTQGRPVDGQHERCSATKPKADGDAKAS